MIYDGKKIIALRQGKGWSMAELARQAKLSQPSVWALEHQRTKKPKADSLFRIATALGVRIQDLMPKKPGAPAKMEEMILSSFHSLTPQNQASLVAVAQALLDSQKK